MDKKTTLKKISLIESLTDEQIGKIETFSEILTCKKEEKLFQVGQEAKNVFILLDGKVSVQVQLTSRPEKLSIVVLGKFGQLVGWSGLMKEAYYTASGVCLEESKLLKIDGEQFLRVLEEDPVTGFIVMKDISSVISQRLRNLQSVVLKTI